MSDNDRGEVGRGVTDSLRSSPLLAFPERPFWRVPSRCNGSAFCALTDVTFAIEHLQQANHHLAEIDEHISAQRQLLGELRAAGEETTESEHLLQSLLEGQLLALAHRRLAKDSVDR